MDQQRGQAAHGSTDDGRLVGQGCADATKVFNELFEIVLAVGRAVAFAVSAGIIADRLPANGGQLASGFLPGVLCLAEPMGHQHARRAIVAVIAQVQAYAVVSPDLPPASFVIVTLARNVPTGSSGFTFLSRHTALLFVRSGRLTRARSCAGASQCFYNRGAT